ncbi:MAG: glycoside hydrolase family 95-like protein [Lachnospiraceae bacterium]
MGVMEMIVQSQNGVIELLPALPKKWKSGHLWGVKVRGNVTVNIDWRDGSLQRAGFYAEKRTEIQICYKNKVEHRLLEAKTWTYGQW